MTCKIICENRSILRLHVSPVYPPIFFFFCVFAVALFFVTILVMTTEPRKPGDQAQPVGYKGQDDERRKGDQTSCRVVD
jgi:hypothetical protein